jgi:hypothetical protein
MSQSHNEATDVQPNEGFAAGIYSRMPLYSSLTLVIPVDNHQHPPRSLPNEASQGESNFVDSSAPIFSMYLDMAEEEDKKIAESWKADAEGILVFVRHYLLVPCLLYRLVVIDWFILRCCRLVNLGIDSGSSTESTGHLQLLPCEYVSSYYCRHKSIQYLDFPPCLPTPIFSTQLCRLGKLALVLKLGHQS